MPGAAMTLNPIGKDKLPFWLHLLLLIPNALGLVFWRLLFRHVSAQSAFGSIRQEILQMLSFYELEDPTPAERVEQNYFSYLAAASLGSLYVWKKTDKSMLWRALAADAAIAVPAALLVSLATFQGPMGLLLAFLALSVALVWRAKIMLRRIRKWYSRKGWIVRKLY